jgi:hypothetical protein
MAIWPLVMAALLGMHPTLEESLAMGAVLLVVMIAIRFAALYFDFTLARFPNLERLVVYSALSLACFVMAGVAGIPGFLLLSEGLGISLPLWTDWVIGAGTIWTMGRMQKAIPLRPPCT